MTILPFGVNQNTQTVFFYQRGKEASCRGIELDPAGGMRSLFVISLPWYILRCIAVPSDFSCQFTDTFPESFFISLPSLLRPEFFPATSAFAFLAPWSFSGAPVLLCDHQKSSEMLRGSSARLPSLSQPGFHNRTVIHVTK